MQTRRPTPLIAALMLSVSALVVAPSAGLAAATKQVTVDNSYSYHPGTVTLAGVGDKVEWINTSAGSKHDVFSSLPGYFASPGGSGGLKPGGHYTRTFTSAGSFGYLCEIHIFDNMKGTVIVPVRVALVDGDHFRVTAASAASGGSWRHVVQVRKPGASTFQTIGTTTSPAVTFKPRQHGTFTFRAAVKNISSDKLSGWSPTVSRSW